MNEFNQNDIVKFKDLLNKWIDADRAKRLIIQSKKPAQEKLTALNYLWWTTIQQPQIQQQPQQVQKTWITDFLKATPQYKTYEALKKTWTIAKEWIKRIGEAWKWLVEPVEWLWRTYTFPEAAARGAAWALQTAWSPIFWVIWQAWEDIINKIPDDIKQDIVENMEPTIEWVTNWWNKQTPEQQQNLRNIWVWLEVLSYYVWSWLIKNLKGKAYTPKTTIAHKPSYTWITPKAPVSPLAWWPVWQTLEQWIKQAPILWKQKTTIPTIIRNVVKRVEEWPKQFKWVVWQNPIIQPFREIKVKWVDIAKSDDLIQRGLRPSIVWKDTWAKIDIYKNKIREWIESAWKRKWIPKDWMDALNKVWESKKDIWKTIENNTALVNKKIPEQKIVDEIFKYLKTEEWLAATRVSDKLKTILTKEIEKYTTWKNINIKELLALKTAQNKKIPSNKWMEMLQTNQDKLLADSVVAKAMWKIYDDAIEEVLWWVNKGLMREYWSLRTLEKDLARRMWVFSRNTQDWIYWLTDVFTLPDMILWGFTGDVKQFLRWAWWRIVKSMIKSKENPNNIIKELFKLHTPKKPWFIEKAIWKEFRGIPKDITQWPVKPKIEVKKPVSKPIETKKVTKTPKKIETRTETKTVVKKKVEEKAIIDKWAYINPWKIVKDVKSAISTLNPKNIATVAWNIAKQLWVDVKKVVPLLKWYVKKYWEQIKNKLADIFDDLADKLWVRSKLFWWEWAIKAPVNNLQKAKNMTQAWSKADDVWKATWWEKGKDGKWRFEIDDRLVYAKQPPKTWTKTLSDVLYHPELYKYYPELKNTKIFVRKLDKNTLWKYLPDRDIIVINWELMPSWQIWAWMSKPFTKQQTKTLLHEIQHKIQKSEWFVSWWDSSILWKEWYRKLAWEVEARNVETRLGMTAAERKAKAPIKTEDIWRTKQVLKNKTWISESTWLDLLDLTNIGKKVNSLDQLKTEIKAWMHNKLIEKIYWLRDINFTKLRKLQLQGWVKTPTEKVYTDIIEFFPKKVNSLAQLKAEIKAWLHDKLLERLYKFKDNQFRKEVIKLKTNKLIKKPAWISKADDLVSEAKKYKSADEFIDNQERVFHWWAGIDEMKKDFKIISPEEKQKYPSSWGWNVWLSTTSNKEYAKQYSQNIWNRNDVLELFINPEAKIYNLWDTHIDDLSQNKLLELSKKYDIIKSNQENEFRIITNNWVKTKAQLKDIWNKANKWIKKPKIIGNKLIKKPAWISKADDLVSEAKKYKSADEFVDAKLNNFRDAHTAPRVDKNSIKVKQDIWWDFSLEEVAKWFHNQPKDYFEPIWRRYYWGYEHWDESFTYINNIIRKQKAWKDISNETITAYRAVPKNIKQDKLVDGDWVTFSKWYAKDHWMNRFDWNYKLIEEEVPVKNVWWDWNDINEWGYDTWKLEIQLKDIWNKANKWIKKPKIIGNKLIKKPAW